MNASGLTAHRGILAGLTDAGGALLLPGDVPGQHAGNASRRVVSASSILAINVLSPTDC
jgi:hypothetical protein